MDFNGLLPPPLPHYIALLSLDNPLNLLLLCVIVYQLYALLPLPPADIPSAAHLPSKPVSYNWRPAVHPQEGARVWRTWTPEELRGYDGAEGSKEGGRILFAIRRKVYDVTTGRSFYGPGGPYAIFAGRDASRGLAKQSFETEMLTPVDEPIDDLGDLSKSEWENLRDWEGHFNSKYIQCGDYIQSR